MFTYCPNCSNPFNKKTIHQHCTNCNTTYYKNPKPTAGMFVIKNDKILVNKRAIEPKKDTYDIPGGFLEPGESPQECVLREVKEETGLETTIIDLIGVYKEIYEKDIDLVNIFFVGEVVNGKLSAHDDVKDLEWVPIDSIPEMGYQSVNEGVHDFVKWYKKNNYNKQ